MRNGLEQLLSFTARLREEKIHFTLDSQRDAIMVIVPSPSRYFEIEFFAEGRIEVQTFGPASEVTAVSIDEITQSVVGAVNGT